MFPAVRRPEVISNWFEVVKVSCWSEANLQSLSPRVSHYFKNHQNRSFDFIIKKNCKWIALITLANF